MGKFERYTFYGFYSHREINKLVISFDPSDPRTKNLLESVSPDGHMPFGADAFYVALPQKPEGRADRIIRDTTPLLGHRVAVTVQMQRYSFESHLEINRGETVRGSRLVFISMKRAN